MSSDDDWETDPDAINDVSEKQQRWGNKGTGKMVDLKAVQAEVRKADEDKAKAKSGFQRGYGGAHGHEASGARRAPAPACACGNAGARRARPPAPRHRAFPPRHSCCARRRFGAPGQHSRAALPAAGCSRGAFLVRR